MKSSRARDRWSFPEVREALWEMQHGKCCYCERCVDTVGGSQQVEHYRPQREYGSLLNEWRNLLLACGRCNNIKGNKFPNDADGLPLIFDPSNPADDPTSRIKFPVDLEIPALIGTCVPANNDARAEVTIRVIDLYGSDLNRARNLYFHNTLHSWHLNLLQAMKSGDSTIESEARTTLEESVSARGQLASFARAWARAVRLDELGIAIPTGASVD